MSGGESEKKFITILVDNQLAAIQRLYRQNGWDYQASVTGGLINNASLLTQKSVN